MSNKPNTTPETEGNASRSCYGSPVPSMQVKTTPSIPPLRELEGWDELNRWGMFNHGQWSAIQQRLLWEGGMSEIDKLRLLAGEMLRFNVELMDRWIETARLVPPPPIFVPLHDNEETQPQ